jgi:hypothetical protein
MATTSFFLAVNVGIAQTNNKELLPLLIIITSAGCKPLDDVPFHISFSFFRSRGMSTTALEHVEDNGLCY